MVQGIMPQRTQAKPIFPDQATAGTSLKLQSRDSDNFTIVKMIRAVTPVAGVFEVLEFDNAETCTLHVDLQMLDRGPARPKLYFLWADIATQDEVEIYVDRRRKEIGRNIACLTDLQDRYEQKIGCHYKST